MVNLKSLNLLKKNVRTPNASAFCYVRDKPASLGICAEKYLVLVKVRLIISFQICFFFITHPFQLSACLIIN